MNKAKKIKEEIEELQLETELLELQLKKEKLSKQLAKDKVVEAPPVPPLIDKELLARFEEIMKVKTEKTKAK